MLTEINVDRESIKKIIENNYDLVVKDLIPVTAGEASWSYKVVTEGELYFFKIHNNLNNPKLRFDLTFKLFNICGIKNITHPIKNKNGQLLVEVDKYPAALFNFISGSNASENSLSVEQSFEVGKLIAKIHKAKDKIGDFEIEEDFTYSNTNRLLENIKQAEKFLNDESSYKKETASLLMKYQEKINNRIQELEELGNKLRNQKLEFVICHGEPHRWNTMIDNNGQIYLIDWDDCLFAPKEKDLNFIKDDAEKLAGYKRIVGDFEINQEIIHYYNLEWNISEIDAWSDQLVHSNFNDEQSKHDLELFIKVLGELDR